MSDYLRKIDDFMIKEIDHIKNPIIVEFGVSSEGRSTKFFLDICKKNNGKLFSLDINDHSKLFNDPNWTFIQSRDDNFDFLRKKLPKEIDIIFLDSLHESSHVEKLFKYYFSYLKVGGHFYIDDISWLPYLKNDPRDSFYCEINNKETFEKLLEIYRSNTDSFDIYFSFISSGICRVIKKKNDLKDTSKIKSRENSLKNLLRKILKFR
tara:strand:+ start:1472 stop:2095 length:624 start_codon:yes stop_codon:yes gene_type:complete